MLLFGDYSLYRPGPPLQKNVRNKFDTTIYAGLDGIRNGTDPGEPVQDDPYRQTDRPAMPSSLMEAVEALDGSAVLRGGFGDRFVDHFLLIKRAEIGRFLAHVTDWEHREYFEMY